VGSPGGSLPSGSSRAAMCPKSRMCLMNFEAPTSFSTSAAAGAPELATRPLACGGLQVSKNSRVRSSTDSGSSLYRS
jgi:hypothetical protein